MERHDTHALSYSSSSNNHSYDFENKNNKSKSNKKIILRNVQGSLNDEYLTDVQMKKISSILNKYKISVEQNLKNEQLFKHNQNTEKEREKEKEKEKEKEINLNQNTLNNTGKKKEKKKKKENSKKDIDTKNNIVNEEIKKEKQKIEENPKDEENKKEEIQKEQNTEIYKKEIKYENKEKEYKTGKDNKFSISYKNNLRDTRFNNIQKNLDSENRRKLRLKKLEDKKLLIYQKVDKQGNLIREIKKPSISFITKIFKDMNQVISDNNNNEKEEIVPGILLSVKNNFCFYTKQFVKNKVYNKRIKILKYQKNNEEINDEKIPTFSSINTSSSNSDFKTKSKSKSKKKHTKTKTKIKSKNFGKKKPPIYSKNMKPQRSISVYSKISKEKSEEGKKSLSKKKKLIIPNVKKRQPYVSERKLVGVNKNIRKYSVVNRNKGKINKLQKDVDKMSESGKINLNDKENNEIDFKKFLEQQRLKKHMLIKNYIKKQGINSYNFFYPKEPSPLLSTFKNKYSIYPTLNVDRKNSVDIGLNNDIIINNRQFYKIKTNPKKIRTFYDRDNFLNGEYKDNKELTNHNNLHLVDKHYGLEKDCPLCRAFQMKKLKDEYNTINFIKTMKYKKIKGNENQQRIFSPNSFWLLNGSEREYSSLSRNRNSSAKKSDYLDEYSQIRKNFVVLFDYFN